MFYLNVNFFISRLPRSLRSLVAIHSAGYRRRQIPHSCCSALRLLITRSAIRAVQPCGFSSLIPHPGKAVFLLLSPFTRLWHRQGLRMSAYGCPLPMSSFASLTPPKSSLSVRLVVTRSYSSHFGLRPCACRCLCLGSPAGRSLPARLSCFLLCRFAPAKNLAKRLPLRGCSPPQLASLRCSQSCSCCAARGGSRTPPSVICFLAVADTPGALKRTLKAVFPVFSPQTAFSSPCRGFHSRSDYHSTRVNFGVFFGCFLHRVDFSTNHRFSSTVIFTLRCYYGVVWLPYFAQHKIHYYFASITFKNYSKWLRLNFPHSSPR